MEQLPDPSRIRHGPGGGVKLTFLGTRGEIDGRSRRHRRHTSTEVGYRGRRVMVDAGEDWRGSLAELRPGAVVVTHAHPDHAWGLEDGSPAPVWATAEAWEAMEEYAIPAQMRRMVEPREPFAPVEGIVFEAFTVEHSIRAPAVGYRIQAGRITIFYAPDLVYIHEREEALSGCSVYVGDGASMKRSLVRAMDDRLVGHASVHAQLGWCEKEGVPRAIFTHCGSQIVEGDERILGPRLEGWAEERGVEAEIAHDGMEVVLRS